MIDARHVRIPGGSHKGKIARPEITLFADRFRFNLQDEATARDLSENWTPPATAELLALVPGTIGFGTFRK